MYRFDEQVLASPVLRGYLKNLAAGDGGTGEYYAVVCRENFETIGLRSSEWSTRPYAAQRTVAEDLCRALNRELHNGGAWLTHWSHVKSRIVISMDDGEFERLHFIWLDGDFDPWFFVTIDEPFHEMVKAPPSHWLGQAAEAWMKAHEMVTGWLAPAPYQQIRAVKGERKRGQ